MKLPLTVACWDYDRTRALFDGRVQVEGCDTNLLSLPVEETFFRALRSQEFDVAELSLSSYTMLRSRGESPYVAIPVYLSRMFRHSAIYVRKDRKIETPADLVGKLVGVPEYQLTAPVWVRGILEDEYGVHPADLRWRTGGVEQAGRHEKVSLTLPPEIDIAPIGEDETLNDALVEGRIDALIAPRAPSSFTQGHPMIGRLFPDFRGVEKAYYTKTGIFPVMHVVGIRKALVEQYPWLASSLLKAFTEAKNHALRELSEVAALKVSLPWLASEYEETVAVMGKDFWRYGIKGNEPMLDAFLGYHHKQGLSARRLAISDLFAPSTLEQVLV
jgi:4,5-dihydroxyphthalate decarboxylase